MKRLLRQASRFGFGLRLTLALVGSLLVVGVVAYQLLVDHLYEHQVDVYAHLLEADAKGVEALGRREPGALPVREIDGLLETIGRRRGAVEAILIGPDNTVRAANIDAMIGEQESDSRINAALRHGETYAGREGDPTLEHAAFEFVTPVRLPGGRYALEGSYTSASFDASTAEVRRVLLLVLGLAVFGVGGLFYAFGGRTLLRHHRLALQRATRDGLTDLPNHRAFQDELDQALAAAHRSGEPLALALLDLDHFKLINDRHGHAHGDAVLRQTAEALRAGRLGDRPFRVGGDEFALLMFGADEKGAEVVLQRLLRTLHAEDISASVGWATLRPGQGAEELRGQADAALYEAKRRGGPRAVGFAEISDQVSVIGVAEREALRRLLGEQRLSTVYQPILSLRGDVVIGIEALMRPDPSLGLAGPEEAFELALHEGSVHELDELCVARALESAPQVSADSRLFLNVAPRTLEQDDGESGWLLEALAGAEVDPGSTVIEVTERIGARTDAVVHSLQRLREEGLGLAIDDVGTGNAGLELLRRIGADFVKLDQTIVRTAATEPNARAVLIAMATFARQTGSTVIAEGIEDEETLEFLRGLSAAGMAPGTVVEAGQGFLLARPDRCTPSAARQAARSVAAADA